ncbi:MAG: molybdopterin guanine dinucleotide synthesis [Paracoccaceae bacterium]
MSERGFDRLLVVDWSAAAVPRRGADSIWIADLDASAERVETANPPTRREAEDRLAATLGAALDRGERVLACFDFPFGYPRGSAAALAGGDWRAVWARLADGLTEGEANANDRFAFAARLNAAFGSAPGPFWGCPAHLASADLGPKKPSGYGRTLPPERRLVEERVRRAQPCWKLAYTGSVGSQALTGIAALERLRRRPALAGRVVVWPFETGLRAPAGPRAALAEIYPSLIEDVRVRKAAGALGVVKDEAQVRLLATALARLDAAGRLDALFAGPIEPLDADHRAVVEKEEAWVLGAGHEAALNAVLDS